MAIVSLVVFMDIITQTLGSRPRGIGEPVVEELSSWITMAAAMFAPAAVGVWLQRARRPLWQAALAHLLGVLIFYAVHVGGFFVLRTLAFPLLLGEPYRADPLLAGALYEAAKDVPAYAVTVTAFWWIVGWFGRPAREVGTPAWFDIRDGARLVRTPLSEILAVRSAGNYAEFMLSDGRTPMMRASLSALEAQLAPQGFVRTHRSWLVNRARMSGFRPDGSGDYTVELGTLEAPLSRRFPQALAALRG
jgi:hypothetical protein